MKAQSRAHCFGPRRQRRVGGSAGNQEPGARPAGVGAGSPKAPSFSGRPGTWLSGVRRRPGRPPRPRPAPPGRYSPRALRGPEASKPGGAAGQAALGTPSRWWCCAARRAAAPSAARRGGGARRGGASGRGKVPARRLSLWRRSPGSWCLLPTPKPELPSHNAIGVADLTYDPTTPEMTRIN